MEGGTEEEMGEDGMPCVVRLELDWRGSSRSSERRVSGKVSGNGLDGG